MIPERCLSESRAVWRARRIDAALARIGSWAGESRFAGLLRGVSDAAGLTRLRRWWMAVPEDVDPLAGSALARLLPAPRAAPSLPPSTVGAWGLSLAWAACALLATLTGSPWNTGGAAGAVILGFLLAARHPDATLGLLFLACAISPRLALPGIPEDAPIRLDDLAAPGLGVALLSRLAHRRPTPGSGIPIAMACYVAIGGVATVAGLIAGTVHLPWNATAHLLKRIEPLLFFAYAVTSPEGGGGRRINVAVGLALMAVAGLGIAEAIQNWIRLGGRWPGPDARSFNSWPWQAESNHVAGLLIAGGFWVLGRARDPGRRLAWLLLAAILAAGVVTTASRTAALGVGAGLAVLAVYTGGWRLPAAAGLMLLLLWPALPSSLRLRFGRDFLVDVEQYQVWSMMLEDGYQHRYSGTRNRIEGWSQILGDTLRHPLCGTGWGSRHRSFYESQWMMELGELGVAGLIGFTALLLALARRLRHAGEVGLLAALAALAAMGLTMNSFAIARTAGPFWMLCGCALGSPPSRRSP
ncbi:MAG: hypothetical protein HYY93_10010 [Planctomycetes bacterium]|nr:hypothetical protein [Planctomycetota bacterium]